MERELHAYWLLAVNFLNPNFLFASLVWSSVGFGYWIYGKKQQTLACMIGGVLMIVVSCFAPPLIMSLVCVALMVVIFMLVKQGY